MTLPASTAAQLESIRVQVASQQPRWGDAETHIPVQRYLSPEIWRAEVQGLFRSLPLIAAHSSEIAPGQVLPNDSYGVPLLLARDAHGELRAFLNVCRHRGMRLVEDTGRAQPKASVVCPYHGWTYKLDGGLRHMLHAEAFDPCPAGARDLVALPCAERHGLVWVVPSAEGSIDLDAFLGGLNDELPFYEIAQLKVFRTIEAEYPANWKLIVDAFLEPYHIRVLHKDTIYPFFTDGITAAERFGPHISSLVARRAVQEWAAQPRCVAPQEQDGLRELATPSQVIFPNTITIFHPDYLSLITLYPTGPETLRWTHRMLIPQDKATPDWAPHWEKTFRLIEQGVFQKEDIHCAVRIQQGFATGANEYVTAGRVEQALAWFHESVRSHAGL
ncbi:MAG: hypothetical protein JWQ07_1974 [Ramlibacter sp.]|nr:hypothetical protein [Ramlibacter sp.]